VQYFAAVEPQRRLAPHIHVAMRGTVSRAELRRVLAATYHQVWWPAATDAQYDGDHRPVWDEATGTYLDPATGEVLPSWGDALDAIGPEDAPRHMARYGARFDAQGVLAGSKDANRCIGYLTKYLTKQVADCLGRCCMRTEGNGMIELQTIEEVADWLRVSVPTVRWLRQEGRFVPAIKVGRRLMWDPRDIDAWLKAQRETAKVA